MADNARQISKNERGRQMLELAPYGLIGLVLALLVAFCFACKDDFAPSEQHSPCSMDDAELRHPKPVERCTGAANRDVKPHEQKHERARRG